MSRFRTATINALGHSHTKPGGNKKGWLSSRVRTRRLVRVLLRRRLSLVGLQEFQAPQRDEFKSRAGQLYAVHAIRDNGVVWLRARWVLEERGALDIPYFHGKPRSMPWVIVRHRRSGKRVAFASTHNPANVRGSAGGWRREGWRIEGEWAREMVASGRVVAALVVGDKNAIADHYLPHVKESGGKVAGIPTATGLKGIDWIVGWGAVRFTRFQTVRNRRIAASTDHPVVQAVAHI